MIRSGPPECSWKVLKTSCAAVDMTVLSSLALGDWVDAAGPLYRTEPYFDAEARKAMKLNIVPWIKTAVYYLVGLVKNCRHAVQPTTIKRVILPPYNDSDKATWCFDFAVGFTALVAMGIFWEAFIVWTTSLGSSSRTHSVRHRLQKEQQRRESYV